MGKLALACVVAFTLAAAAQAEDVKVTADAGSKVKVTVEPQRKGLMERLRERRMANRVVVVPGVVVSTEAIPAEVKPVAPAPRVIGISVKK